MFKNLSIRKKLFVGIGLAIGCLIVVWAVATFGLLQASAGYDRYSKIAYDSVLLGRIQANVLEARIGLKNYVASGNASFIGTVNDRLNAAKESFNEADSRIGVRRREKRKYGRSVRGGFDAYAQGVADAVRLHKAQEEEVAGLTALGESMVQGLTAIVDQASHTGNAPTLAAAAKALAVTMAGRIDVVRLLATQDPTYADELTKRLGDELGSYLGGVEGLHRRSRDPSRRRADRPGAPGVSRPLE